MKKEPTIFKGLMLASIKNNWQELASYFIEKGATDFNTAFKAAAFYGNIEVMKYLIDKGVNNFNSSLEHAFSNEKIESVKYLVEIMQDRNIPIDFNIVIRFILRGEKENFAIIKYMVEKFPENFDISHLAEMARKKGKNNLYNYLITRV